MTELKLPEINRVIVAGRLTRDPDRRYAQDGTAVTRFDVAFHRRFRRNGQLAESTGFVPVLAVQRLAEVCGEYLKKGSPVVVEGRLAQRDWTSAEGAKRSRLEIQADNVHFLERRPEGNEAPAASSANVVERNQPKPEEGARARKHGERS